MTELMEIEKAIMNLPPEERAFLAHRLWDSLEGFADPETEQAWLDEANRRWKEIEDGNVRCIPAEVVMKQARAVLKT